MPVKAHITNPADGMIAEVNDRLDGRKRLCVDAVIDASMQEIPVEVTIVQTNPTNLQVAYLLNGSTHNMKVNGSVTPVVYTYPADPLIDTSVHELRFIFAAASFNWSGLGFGKNAAGALTNGILVELVVNDGTLIPLNTVKINEDFLRTFGETPVIDSSGATVVLVSSYRFGGEMILKANTSDCCRVTIRDDLTGGAWGVNYLTATFFGTRRV